MYRWFGDGTVQAMSKPALPTGIVTYLLTDVEGSTGHWARSGAAAAMGRQRELVAAAVVDHGGLQPVEQGEGDSTVAVFHNPVDALAAAIAIQRSLDVEAWPAEPVAVRIGVHTGQAELVDERTFGGQGIIRCARLRDLAHGHQVLVSAATAELTQDLLPEGVALRELGTVHLKGLDRPERPHQLEHPDLRRLHPPLPTEVPATRLPTYPTSFIGRADEIVRVCQLADEARLVTITGAGGSGKTRLAHQVALRVDDAVWVDLCRVDDESLVAGAVASACGLAESPGDAGAASKVTSHLRSNRRLLVLDNCEHVLNGAADLVSSILGHDGPSVVLVTSREPLGVAGETVWRVPSLEVPADDAALPVVAAASAVELFCARARSGSPDFVLDETSAPSVVAVCRRVDGIPLAIELAAARLRTMTLADLVTGLDDRFRLLSAGVRSLERQRTLLASIDWSHDLLDEDERVLFRRLGVFIAPFELAAAESVGTDDQLDQVSVFDLLARLVDKSLVQSDARGFSMLETIRQYATAKAVDAGEIVVLRRRHLAWFLGRIEAWGFEVDRVTVAAQREADAVLPDLRAAFDWALEQDRASAPPLLSALAELVGVRELSNLARSACDQEEEGTAAWGTLLGTVLHLLPMALDDWWIGPATALLDGEAPPRVRRRIEFALVHMGLFAGDTGSTEAAERLVADALVERDEVFATSASMALAMGAAVNGDLDRAERLLPWLERRYPNHVVTPFLRSTLTQVLVARGEMSAALESGLNRPRTEVRMPVNYVGDFLAAAMTRSTTVLDALEVEIDRREFQGAAETVPAMVRFWIAIVAGDLDAAEAHNRQWIESLFLADHFPVNRVHSAQIALARGDLEFAAAEVEAAASMAVGVAHLTRGFAGLAAAEIAHAGGAQARSLDEAHRALDLAERNRLRWVSIPVLELLAVVAGARDEMDLAARLMGACLAFRDENGFAFRWPHAERQVDALIPLLDVEVVERGRAMSIDDAVAMARGTRGERSRPAFGWDAVTPAENRVVDLVAAGLSNQQIAEKLFVTIATVKTHLVHVYRKLELDSRAGLIAAAIYREQSPGE